MEIYFLIVVVIPAVALAVRRWAWRRSTGEHDRKAAARMRLRRGGKTIEDGATVTLTGVARALGEPFTAPLSGRLAIGYTSRADACSIEPGKRSQRPTFVAEILRTEIRPFVLETTGGRLVVDAQTAHIELPMSPIIPRQLDAEAAFVATSEHAAPDVIGVDFREAIIEDGDRIAVAGVIVMTREHTAGREYGYRDEPLVARIAHHERWPITIGLPR